MFIKSINPSIIAEFSQIGFGFDVDFSKFYRFGDFHSFSKALLIIVAFFALTVFFAVLSLTGEGAREEFKRLNDLQSKKAVTIYQGSDCGIIHKKFKGLDNSFRTFETTPSRIECHVQVF